MSIPTSTFHVFEFERFIEQVLRESIAEKYPLDWKEDTITGTFLPRLRSRLPEVNLYGLRYPLTIKWEFYKLHGTAETQHGDIGLLVQYLLPNGQILEGAGFLEAKARDRNSAKFPQVKFSQLNRIQKKTPLAQLLLYDYNQATVLDGLEDFFGDRNGFYYMDPTYESVAKTTHSPLLPIALAIGVGKYDDSLYRFCHSFGHQLTRRFIQMRDLDFSKALIDVVKGFPGKIGAPRHIMVIQISPAGKGIPEKVIPSPERYSILE
jgi:hypothetical protein